MSQIGRKMIVAVSVLALALPAAAVAGQGQGHGKGKAKGKGKTHNVAYVFKGIYAGEGSVEVKAGNSRVRKGGFIGETVEFQLEGARIVVADTNGDTMRDLSDVQTGDKVLVKCMLPRKDPGTQPYDAKRLVDQTHPVVPAS